MKLKTLICLWVLVVTPNTLLASRVRELHANDKSMQNVFLALGRSTVLRFNEKPKTAVIGNQNYFGLEYIGNDITIQPLGITTTNLFVYTEHQTYGLLLKVSNGSFYDDMVHVHYRPSHIKIAPKPKHTELMGSREIQGEGVVKDSLKVELKKLTALAPQGIVMLDMKIKNVSQKIFKTKDLKSKVFEGTKEVASTRVVAQKDEIAPGEETEARIVVRASVLKNGSLEVTSGGKTLKIKIAEKRTR